MNSKLSIAIFSFLIITFSFPVYGAVIEETFWRPHLPINKGILPRAVDKDYRTNISYDEKIKVIAVIFAETLGEGEEGRQAVVNVIFNRADKYQKNLFEIISAENQFTAFSIDNNLYARARDFLRGKIDISESNKEVLKSIEAMIDEEPEDITKGADHYLRIEHSEDLSWCKQEKFTVKIGHHSFYKLWE
jgi:hypothetical protein